MKLLVVDDSRVMRQIITRTLRQAGFSNLDIVEAEDGADGLTKAMSEHPDLILSGWNMPVTNGLEFLLALRAAGSSIPFGFVTSEGSAPMREQAAAAGAAFLIAKPFTADMFEALPRLNRTDHTGHNNVEVISTPSNPPESTRIPAETTLPARQAVRETFEILMGRTIKSGDGTRVTLDLSTGPISVGTFIDDHGFLSAIVAADLPLTVLAGSCLGLLPAGGAKGMVAKKELTDKVNENFYEVLNILSAAFNTEGAPHVRLGEVYTDPSTMPPAVLLTVKSLTHREDVFINIAGYGIGNLSIVLTPQP